MTSGSLAVLGAGLSLCLGLAFVFVRAPHPWGWEGIDDYRKLGLALSHGEPYPTLERIWGYPAFLAACYSAFGDRQWIPLVIQVGLNATIPLLVFGEARRTFGARTAGLAALLVGIFSFNTVYASTQAADALCTFAFVATIVCVRRGEEHGALSWFAAGGAFAAASLLLRPNLLLFPLFLALVHLARPSPARHWRGAAAFLLVACALWVPWPIRNYRLTGRYIPATTHGGKQLWYGSLQAGAYFERWFDNPAAQAESAPFEYSLPDGLPIRVRVTSLGTYRPASIALVYWTSRAPAPVRLEATATDQASRVFTIPPQDDRTVVYYYAAAWDAGPAERLEAARLMPAAGPKDPLRHIVTSSHFGDVDFDRGLLDVFDVFRLATDSVPAADRTALDLDRDGRVTDADLRIAIGTLVVPSYQTRDPDLEALRSVGRGGDRTTITLSDGSSLAAGTPLVRTTDVNVAGSEASMAANLVRSSRSLWSITRTDADVRDFAATDRQHLVSIQTKQGFEKLEPQLMDRYNQLALENIRRDPWAFAVASGKRVIRMFIILGADDDSSSFQSRTGRVVFALGTVVSVVVAALFVAGLFLAMRRGEAIWLLVAAIAYIPLTIFPFLTNVRYTITAQPFVFIFVAASLVWMFDTLSGAGRRPVAGGGPRDIPGA